MESKAMGMARRPGWMGRGWSARGVRAIMASALTFAACGGGGDGGASGGTGVPTTPAVRVGSVSVALPAASLRVGGTFTATAEVRSTAGDVLNGRAITWTSSNPAAATVTSAGVVSGVAPGSATILAAVDGVTGAAALTVTPAPVATVSVTAPSQQVITGRTVQATATLRDDGNAVLTGRTVAWSTSNAAVATVDATGLVTGVAAGSATITVSAEGKSGTMPMSVVLPPVQTVTVTLASATLVQGVTTRATAALQDDRGAALTGRAVTWSSSAPAVATVDTAGTVTAVGVGTASITATSEGKSASASVTVIAVPVASVTVTLAQSTLVPGASTTVTAVPLDANGRALSGRVVAYASSAPTVATVNAQGLVQAVSFGTATITATVEGRSGQATLNVAPPVASVVFNGTLRQKVGDAYPFTITARTTDGSLIVRPITWRVREVGRASVTGDGVVTPLQAGAFTLVAVIDGVEWTASYTAYDWDAFSSGGTSFLSLESDITVTNQFGRSVYPTLIASCSSTGNFYVWVMATNIITANGVVAYSFDGGTPIADTWDELSPDFNTLWKRGSNTTKKALALQIALSSRFSFAFGEYRSVTRSTTWRVNGLASRLPSVMALCPAPVVASGGAAADSVAEQADRRRVMAALGVSSAPSGEALRRAQAGPAEATSRLLEQWPEWQQPETQVGVRVRR